MSSRITGKKNNPGPSHEKALLEVDIFMFVLILINILFFIFDWLFNFTFFRQIVRQFSPAFYNYYAGTVHPNFILYDIWFVIIYVIEIVVRWAINIWRHTYPRWYLYPMVHWYDVLGCIPVGAFRWLRLLRLFSISGHLHKMGVIDLTQTFFYKFGYRLYSIFVEEVTDRVFIVLLDALQKEITSDTPNGNSLAAEAIKPQQQELVKWIAHRIQSLTRANYTEQKETIRRKIYEVITGGLQKSDKLKKWTRLPFVGKGIVSELGETISQVSFNLIDNLAQTVYIEQNTAGLEMAINNGFNNLVHGEKDAELDRLVKDILARAIERVKSDIKVKIWELDE